MATGKLALRRMKLAVGLGQRALLGIFLGRPIGMAGFSIHVGERGVYAVQVRQLFGGLVVEEEAAAELAALYARVGHQCGDVRRSGIGLLQLLEGRRGGGLIGHAEAVPDARIFGGGIGQLAVFDAGFVQPFRVEECAGEQAARLEVGGLGGDCFA